MPFTCSLQPNHPFDIIGAANGADVVVRVAAGYNTDTLSTFSAVIALSPRAGGEVELIFSIVESDCDGEETYWDGADTLGLIPDKAHRKLIVEAICACVDLILEENAPGAAWLVTHTENLPVKALRKFACIHRVFKNRGYVVGEPDHMHGRVAWKMERAAY